jgi:hypothetical protein
LGPGQGHGQHSERQNNAGNDDGGFCWYGYSSFFGNGTTVIVRLHRFVTLWQRECYHALIGIKWRRGSASRDPQVRDLQFHRLDLTRQAGFIVTVYDEYKIALPATHRRRCGRFVTPVQMFDLTHVYDATIPTQRRVT